MIIKNFVFMKNFKKTILVYSLSGEILIFLFFNIFTSNLSAQVYQGWVQRYTSSGDYSDVGRCIATDNLGDIIVSGTLSTRGIVIIKYSSTGLQKWNTIYPGEFNIGASVYSMAVDNLNNIYVTGYSSKPGTEPDLVTLKYDSDGVLDWLSIYDSYGLSWDQGVSVKVDNAGFVYVSGNTSVVEYNYDFITLKYDGYSGDTLWVRRFDDGSSVFDMTIDNYSNVYVTGRGVQGFCTIKYDRNGSVDWIVNSQVGSEPHAIALDRLFNVYVTGERYGQSTEFDCVTEKYDSNGTIKWSKIYNNFGVNHYDNSNSIAVDDSSNVFIGGRSDNSAYISDFLVVKYNTFGVQQWVNRFSGVGSGDDAIHKIILDKYGNCYATGSSENQYATMKYSPSGIQQWVMFYHYMVNGFDYPTDISLDSIGNVYVTGYSRAISAGDNNDIATVKYTQTVGIHLINHDVPAQFKLHQNYPNPFNPKTVIPFSLKRSAYVRLIAYDFTGRKVQKMVEGNYSAGEYEVDFMGKFCASGVYLYRIEVQEPGGNKFVDTKKMILIK